MATSSNHKRNRNGNSKSNSSGGQDMAQSFLSFAGAVVIAVAVTVTVSVAPPAIVENRAQIAIFSGLQSKRLLSCPTELSESEIAYTQRVPGTKRKAMDTTETIINK